MIIPYAALFFAVIALTFSTVGMVYKLMKMGMQEIDWNYAGACLAQSDDIEQAKFLKAFVRECGTWGTHYQVEMQLAGVNHLLDKNEKEVLSMITYRGDDDV